MRHGSNTQTSATHDMLVSHSPSDENEQQFTPRTHILHSGRPRPNLTAKNVVENLRYILLRLKLQPVEVSNEMERNVMAVKLLCQLSCQLSLGLLSVRPVEHVLHGDKDLCCLFCSLGARKEMCATSSWLLQSGFCIVAIPNSWLLYKPVYNSHPSRPNQLLHTGGLLIQ